MLQYKPFENLEFTENEVQPCCMLLLYLTLFYFNILILDGDPSYLICPVLVTSMFYLDFLFINYKEKIAKALFICFEKRKEKFLYRYFSY